MSFSVYAGHSIVGKLLLLSAKAAREETSGAAGDVLIVELNPFDEQTEAGLFTWEDPEDRALLERGPLGLRMATHPRPRRPTVKPYA